MADFLKALVAHLRDNRGSLVRNVNVVVEFYDPTFGLRHSTDDIEVIDFDALCNEIDRFAEEFK